MSILAFACLALAAADRGEVGPGEFARLEQSHAAALEDVTFVYEGALRWVGPKRLLGQDPEAFGTDFQGIYSYRSDEAALLDVYWMSLSPTGSVVRKRTSVLKGSTETESVNLDAKRERPSIKGQNQGVRKARGAVGSLGGFQSPQTFFLVWTLSRLLKEPQSWGYEFQGWEPVDGRTCLRFQVNARPGGDKPDTLNFRRYWVDMERSGQPLAREQYADGKLESRLDGIRLTEVELKDGKSYWLPVSARLRGYSWENATYNDPVVEQTYNVVAGTILANTGLPDSVFSLGKAAATAAPKGVQAVRQSFAGRPLQRKFAAEPVDETPRMDPEGIRLGVEARLAEANAQSEELKSSSKARQVWGWESVLGYGLAVLGLGLLGAAALWAFRSRGAVR